MESLFIKAENVDQHHEILRLWNLQLNGGETPEQVMEYGFMAEKAYPNFSDKIALSSYVEELDGLGITDDDIRMQTGKTTAYAMIESIVLLLLLLPFVAVGLLAFGPIGVISNAIVTKRMKTMFRNPHRVKGKDFPASYYQLFSILQIPLYLIIVSSLTMTWLIWYQEFGFINASIINGCFIVALWKFFRYIWIGCLDVFRDSLRAISLVTSGRRTHLL
jgi:hypothetical protein